jgi:hypothetical protein
VVLLIGGNHLTEIMQPEPATTEPIAPQQPSVSKPSRFGLRFSLRTLLFLMVAVAMFFAGRVSVTHVRNPPPALAGPWQATIPGQFDYPFFVSIEDLGEGKFLLRTRDNPLSGSLVDILAGVYQWEDGQLVVTHPEDSRMKGLVWRWDGRQLTLVAEPKQMPGGESYVGTTLTVLPAPK